MPARQHERFGRRARIPRGRGMAAALHRTVKSLRATFALPAAGPTSDMPERYLAPQLFRSRAVRESAWPASMSRVVARLPAGRSSNSRVSCEVGSNCMPCRPWPACLLGSQSCPVGFEVIVELADAHPKSGGEGSPPIGGPGHLTPVLVQEGVNSTLSLEIVDCDERYGK